MNAISPCSSVLHDLPAPSPSFSMPLTVPAPPPPFSLPPERSARSDFPGAMEQLRPAERRRRRKRLGAGLRGGGQWRAPRPAALRAVRRRLRESLVPARAVPALPDSRTGFPRPGCLRGKTASCQQFLLLLLLRKCPAGKFAAGGWGRPRGLCGGG